jgi:hypothetical protein
MNPIFQQPASFLPLRCGVKTLVDGREARLAKLPDDVKAKRENGVFYGKRVD